jgi:hypothetical protein
VRFKTSIPQADGFSLPTPPDQTYLAYPPRIDKHQPQNQHTGYQTGVLRIGDAMIDSRPKVVNGSTFSDQSANPVPILAA